ncbi:MAG: hypothetical protein ABIY55_28360, partial [Kofleriaceae bacterium]
VSVGRFEQVQLHRHRSLYVVKQRPDQAHVDLQPSLDLGFVAEVVSRAEAAQRGQQVARRGGRRRRHGHGLARQRLLMDEAPREGVAVGRSRAHLELWSAAVEDAEEAHHTTSGDDDPAEIGGDDTADRPSEQQLWHPEVELVRVAVRQLGQTITGCRVARWLRRADAEHGAAPVERTGEEMVRVCATTDGMYAHDGSDAIVARAESCQRHHTRAYVRSIEPR